METINTTDTKKICGIFITANADRDKLWIKDSRDLTTSLRELNNPDWRETFLPEEYQESINVVYWRKAPPEELALQCKHLRAAGHKFLTEMINRFNPGWEDLYDVLIPKDSNPPICPHCGEEIYAEMDK